MTLTESQARKAEETTAAAASNHVEENKVNTSSNDVDSATGNNDGLTSHLRHPAVSLSANALCFLPARR